MKIIWEIARSFDGLTYSKVHALFGTKLNADGRTDIYTFTWEAIHAYAIVYAIPSKYPKRITNFKIDPIFNDNKKRKTGNRTYTRTYEESNICRNCLLRAIQKEISLPILMFCIT